MNVNRIQNTIIRMNGKPPAPSIITSRQFDPSRVPTMKIFFADDVTEAERAAILAGDGDGVVLPGPHNPMEIPQCR